MPNTHPTDQEKYKPNDREEYREISNDWRHRDNLTWQLPPVIVVLGGAFISAAFAIQIESDHRDIIRIILLTLGALLSLCLTITLAQNLWYQVGSGEALKRLVAGKEIPRSGLMRTLSPSEFNISFWDFVKLAFHPLTGSFILFSLCVIVTLVLFSLLGIQLLIKGLQSCLMFAL